MEYWSPVCQELQPPKIVIPLWSLQIKNTAPFSLQPNLVCRIPQRGLRRVQKGDYDYQCAAVLLSTGVMLQLGRDRGFSQVTELQTPRLGTALEVR